MASKYGFGFCIIFVLISLLLGTWHVALQKYFTISNGRAYLKFYEA